MVKHLPDKQEIGGSSPSPCTIIEVLMAFDDEECDCELHGETNWKYSAIVDRWLCEECLKEGFFIDKIRDEVLGAVNEKEES